VLGRTLALIDEQWTLDRSELGEVAERGVDKEVQDNQTCAGKTSTYAFGLGQTFHIFGIKTGRLPSNMETNRKEIIVYYRTTLCFPKTGEYMIEILFYYQ